MYICILQRSGERPRFMYEVPLRNSAYLESYTLDMNTLSMIKKGIKTKALLTLEEAEHIVKKYHRYHKRGKITGQKSTVYITKASKWLKVNKEQLKRY